MLNSCILEISGLFLRKCSKIWFVCFILPSKIFLFLSYFHNYSALRQIWSETALKFTCVCLRQPSDFCYFEWKKIIRRISHQYWPMLNFFRIIHTNLHLFYVAIKIATHEANRFSQLPKSQIICLSHYHRKKRILAREMARLMSREAVQPIFFKFIWFTIVHRQKDYGSRAIWGQYFKA